MEDTSWVKPQIEALLSGELDSKYEEIYNDKLNRFNGKLYKYCSFSDDDKNQAISNLENNVFYFSKPEIFNDPFDCYLGLSTDEILIAGVTPYFDKEWTFSGENAELTKVMVKRMLLGDVIENKQHNDSSIVKLIKFLIKSPEMLQLLKQKESGEDVTEDDIKTFFINALSTPEKIFEFLGNISNPNELKNLQTGLKKDGLQKIILEIFKNPEVLEIMMPKEEDEQPIIGCLSELVNESNFLKRIKSISKVTGVDINEIEEKITELEHVISQQMPIIKEKINELIGITCFAKRPDNILMWSHYANKHTGFCVEYDLSKIQSQDFRCMLYPVIYENTRPIIPTEMFDFSDMQNIKLNLEPKVMSKFICALLTKSPIWNYEEEWRVILFLNNLDKQCLYENCISKIYLGANISDENKKKIEIIAAKKQIVIEHMTIDLNKFSLLHK